MNRYLYILSVVFISIGALSCSDDKGAQVTPTEAAAPAEAATTEAATTEAAPADAAVTEAAPADAAATEAAPAEAAPEK